MNLALKSFDELQTLMKASVWELDDMGIENEDLLKEINSRVDMVPLPCIGVKRHWYGDGDFFEEDIIARRSYFA